MQQDGNDKNKIAVFYAVDGEVRFLSHRDTVRLWQRALARAEAPVSFSQGFNPHMRLSFALPRSVGMASRAELLVIELTESWSSEKLISALRGTLPVGIDILEVRAIVAPVKVHPSWARYQIHLSKQADREQITHYLEKYHQASTWRIYRSRRGRHPARTIDLKQVITELELKADGLYCTLDLSGEVTGRLDEVLEIPAIHSPEFVAKVKRIDVGYAEELRITN
jgi:radical SAM-linked protein